jgi:hypothetical protein
LRSTFDLAALSEAVIAATTGNEIVAEAVNGHDQRRPNTHPMTAPERNRAAVAMRVFRIPAAFREVVTSVSVARSETEMKPPACD